MDACFRELGIRTKELNMTGLTLVLPIVETVWESQCL